jgi:hypothetical protein
VKRQRFLEEPCWETRIWRCTLATFGGILTALGIFGTYWVLTDTRIHRHAGPSIAGPVAMLFLGGRMLYQAWSGESKWLMAMRDRHFEIEERRLGLPRRAQLTEAQQIERLQQELSG